MSTRIHHCVYIYIYQRKIVRNRYKQKTIYNQKFILHNKNINKFKTKGKKIKKFFIFKQRKKRSKDENL